MATLDPTATLDALLIERAQSMRDRQLYHFLDDKGECQRSLTYGELFDRAAGLARVLLATKRETAMALVVAGPELEHTVALFGCFLAGLTAIPLYPPTSENSAAATQTIVAVCAATRSSVLLATPPVAADVLPPLQSHLGIAAPQWISIGDGHLCGADAETFPGSRPLQPALLLFTSGSTGRPKGAIVTHKGLVKGVAAAAAQCVPTMAEGDIHCNWMPHCHVSGLLGRLYPFITGGTGVTMTPRTFLANPIVWLQALTRYRVKATLATDFGFAYAARAVQRLAEEDKHSSILGTLDLSCLELAFSGGEAVRLSTIRSVAQSLAPYGFRTEALRPCYGLTEAPTCTGLVDGELLELPISRAAIGANRVVSPTDETDRIILIGNGTANSDTEIAIVAPESRMRVEPGSIGEIWIRGTSVTPGYVGVETGSDEWQGGIAGEPEGTGTYFRTGDLGFLHAGQLFVTGRFKELLIVRGKNHYPIDIEDSVMRTGRPFGVAQCAVFAVQDRAGLEALGLALELDDAGTERETLLSAVRGTVSRQHGLSIARLFVLPAGAIPRTTTKKVGRLACRSAVERDHWPAYEVMAAMPQLQAEASSPGTGCDLRWRLSETPKSGRRSVVVEFLRDALQQMLLLAAAPAADTEFSDLGMDSLMEVELCNRLNKDLRLDPPLGATVLFDHRNLTALAAVIDERLRTVENWEALNRSTDNELAGQENSWRLSNEEKRLWLLDRARGGDPSMTIGLGVLMLGRVDADELELAVRRTLDEQPALLQIFPEVDTEPVRAPLLRLPQPLVRWIDLKGTKALSDSIAQTIRDESRKAFPITVGPLFQFTAFRANTDQTAIFVRTHHLVSDRKSLWAILCSITKGMESTGPKTASPSKTMLGVSTGK